jgi:phosphoglycerate dehydrogenase-like enzyme
MGCPARAMLIAWRRACLRDLVVGICRGDSSIGTRSRFRSSLATSACSRVRCGFSRRVVATSDSGSRRGSVAVVVVAPNLGRDLKWVAEIDSRVRVIDGNDIGPERDAVLAEAEVLLVGFPVPSELAARAPGLRWAHHTQAGVSNFHSSDLWSSSVMLTSSRGHVAATAIAEYVIAAAFHFASGLQEATRQKSAGEFIRASYDLRTVTGSTMGVVGLGGIGGEVARLARVVGMRVVASRRSATSPQENVDGVDLLLPSDRLTDLVAESDVVAVCAQLTVQTRRIINARVFAAMRPNAILVNVARGEVVDEEALVRALQQRQIRGAVLDVYDGELDGRPPRRELVELPQVVLTPHIAGVGDTAGRERSKELFAENLRRFLDGRPLLNVVDRNLGY